MIEEKVIAEHSLTIERKTFTLSLRENGGGKFLRVTEEKNGRRNTIIVPGSGLAEFQAKVTELAGLGK